MSRYLILCLLLSTALAWADPCLSPDGRNAIFFRLDQQGRPSYRVERDGQVVLKSSPLGFVFKDQTLLDGFTLERSTSRLVDEQWRPLWGESSNIRNHYREHTLYLRSHQRAVRLYLRAYNDGVAFRLVIPKQPGFEQFELIREATGFTFAADHTAWWIPDNWDTYEEIYSQTPLSAIGHYHNPLNPQHTHGSNRPAELPHGCNTPVTIKAADDLYLSIHEANLTDYAGMTLVPAGQFAFTAQLVPWPDGVAVRGQAPLTTPWRTIQLASTPGGLIESHLILNLNEPNQLTETDYIKPMKLLGIWWKMHLGAGTWAREGGRHSATTENAKRYLEFAANNGFDGVLVEGWNTGWESWYQDDNFDFTTPYPDFDLPEVTRFARAHGVQLVGHLETGGQIESFEKRLEAALSQYEKLGVTSVKTGYAGQIRPEGQHHHGQWMVRHYRKVVEAAARHHITVNAHEPIKPTGLRRTYPNMMTREGVRGMEWNAWSRGNPPEHTVNLAFTRMLAGPLDYTPGIFDLDFSTVGDEYRHWNAIDGLETTGRMHSTLSRQLALFVVLYSPIQMASDLIENYDHPAFAFLREVPVNWDETRVLTGAIGDHVTIARRWGVHWYIGSITDEQARKLTVKLDFLEPGKTYQATVYGDSAQTTKNPEAYQIDQLEVKAGQTLKLELAPAGGQAIAIHPVD